MRLLVCEAVCFLLVIFQWTRDLARDVRRGSAWLLESKAVLRDVENDERLNLCLEGIKVLE